MTGAILHYRDVPPEWNLAVIFLVALERVVELVVSRRNHRRLLAQGGVEVGAGHYPLIVGLHGAWLASLVAAVVLAPARLNPGLLCIFAALQPLRLWVIATLGRYWTTRIVTVPGAPLISAGPYRLLRHPNYLIVVLEIAVLPLAFGAWPLAVVFSIANAGVLVLRIKAEEIALAARQASAALNTRRATS